MVLFHFRYPSNAVLLKSLVHKKQWEDYKRNLVESVVKRRRPWTAPPAATFVKRIQAENTVDSRKNLLDAHLFFQQDVITKTRDVNCLQRSRARRLATFVCLRKSNINRK